MPDSSTRTMLKQANDPWKRSAGALTSEIDVATLQWKLKE